jgi:hypothetical protein
MVKRPIATIHVGPANQGKWTVPVSYDTLLHHTPIATAHKKFMTREPGGWHYRREPWWVKPDGSHMGKWPRHLAALRAHPFVVLTDDDWNADDEEEGVKRRSYICLYRIADLSVDDKKGMNFRMVERIEIRTSASTKESSP